MSLRRYQAAVVREVGKAWARGERRVLIQLATGGGKTHIAAELVRRAGARRVLYVVPRDKILEQTAEKLRGVGVEPELLTAGRHPSLFGVKCLLAMSQTLSRRRNDRMFRSWAPELVLIDEAHTLYDQHLDFLLDWPRVPVVAMSATPDRLDGRDLHELYPTFVCGPQIAALQQAGYLVPSWTFDAPMPDLTNVRVRKGDYVRRDLSERYGQVDALRAAPEAWARYAGPKRRTLVFAPSTDIGKALVRSYAAAGAKPYYVDGNTGTRVRTDALRALDIHQIDVLINCALYVEGLDVRSIDCVQIFTSTWSLPRYLQMPGRGLRTSPETGKKNLHIIDHGGLWRRFGFVDADRDWDNYGQLLNNATAGRCTECGVLLPSWKRSRRCPRCSTLPRAPKRQTSAAAISRRQRLASRKTPHRPCPEWAVPVMAVWHDAERRRVLDVLPLTYSETTCRRALAASGRQS